MPQTSVRRILRDGTLTDLNLRAGQSLVLLALVDHADTTGVAWPSQTTLALETGMERSGVRKALDVLLKREVVQLVQAGGPGRSARYRILPSTLGLWATG